MRNLQLSLLLSCLSISALFGQKITLDGYVFEEHNRGYLNEVKVTVLDNSGVYIGETMSDMQGHFTYDVDAGKDYVLQYEKKIFQTVTDKVSTVGKTAGEKIFVKKQLERQPGYLLEITLAEKRYSEDVAVDGVNGARIEIYNITKNKDELVIESAKSPTFSTTLQQGNHYAIMVRKKGFFTKRMDAHVNIDGCYLCMEGFGTVNPGVTSNLTAAEDNKLGTLLANVELDRVDTNRNLVLRNIYYGYNSAEITDNATKELDKLVTLLKVNAGLIIELGSHTDARGSDEFNLKLSQGRAEAAVNYIVGVGGIERSRIRGKGYGELQILNRCKNGVPCAEDEHVRNRRTELKIVGFRTDENEGKSLGEMIRYEELQKFIASQESTKEYKAPANATQTAPNKTDALKQSLPIKVEERPEVLSKKITTKTEVREEKIAQPTPSVKDQNNVTTSAPKVEVIAKQPIETSNVVADKQILEAIKVNLLAVEKDFTGYKVEVFNSPTELVATDPDLRMIAAEIMSNIDTDKLKNGSFSYMVGNFTAWGETERFLDKVIAKYPKAKIVDYFKGKRIGQ